MAEQGDRPRIWGAKWKPAIIEHKNSLTWDDLEVSVRDILCQRHEGHLPIAVSAISSLTQRDGLLDSETAYSALSQIEEAIIGAILESRKGLFDHEEILPRRSWAEHLGRRDSHMLIDLRLALQRRLYEAAITLPQRIQWYRWMVRTREVDEVLKNLFGEGMETPFGTKFGGKGFRSTWQEAIVAVATALNLPEPGDVRAGFGDIVAPMIRDLGLALAMGQSPTEAIAAQMGKSGSLMDGGISGSGGRDLHIGKWDSGILPPSAPLPIATATSVGLAFASLRKATNRYTVACIGEGGSSSGEWWEALNLAAVRGLPIAFILENNQIALDTPPIHQSAAELWSDKAMAMGIPAWSIDGTSPEKIHSSIAVAREFGLSEDGGPVLIHLEVMRGCGHAHHHDDLYLGSPSGQPPGFVDKELMEYWSNKDPIPQHRNRLLEFGVDVDELNAIDLEEHELVAVARSQVEAMPWPTPMSVTRGIFSFHDAPAREEQIARFETPIQHSTSSRRIGAETLSFSDAPGAWTYSKAIQQALLAAADRWPDEVIFFGEDMETAGAFGLNLALLSQHSERLVDAPLSESAIIHSMTGAALGGLRPVAEIQFGGFSSLAMNPLVNNAAMLRWRWGADVPLTVRIPVGARTYSGPFHAKQVEAWFANDPGLVLLAPSTPQAAYDLLLEAIALPDPCVFLEHIGLYGLRGGRTGWGDRIDQEVDSNPVNLAIDNGALPFQIGQAHVLRWGDDLTIVTWSAMSHVALEAASLLSREGIEVEVIDLGTLIPFDAKTCTESVQRTGRLIVLQEAQWTGGFGHTISSRILEDSFWALEAPPIVIGSLDTPVPFSPPLEHYTVPSSDDVINAVHLLLSN